jgi:hypothetical protein
MSRMTDKRLAEIELAPMIHHVTELLQAFKAERQHAGLLDDSRLGAELRIKELVEAIESYTGACPEFKTLEPCFSEECLMFRKALAGMTDKTKPQPSSPDSS